LEQLANAGIYGKYAQCWINHHSRKWFANRYFRNRNNAPWKVRDYQRLSLESFAPRKVHCDGRDVGKTTEIEITACWAMVLCPNTEMLVATQCDNHLFPLMDRLVRRFQTTPEFAPSLVEVKRQPSWFLRFSNGFCLWGRIAGPHGINFQGLHVDWQIIDEAQEMTEAAWAEMYQALNAGGKRWVYGVPNGLRNTFYRMTQLDGAEHYNWPSTLNPEFDDAKDRELTALYGGKNSPGYIHRVLGLHGAPAHAVFNLEDYLACVDDALDFTNIAVQGDQSFDGPDSVEPGHYYLGCDLGYARDPSEFVVFRAHGPHLINVLRLHLAGVSYARQQDMIRALNDAFDFRSIGIDCGNSGRAVAHNLMADGPEWCDRVQAFEFGATLNLTPLPNGAPNRRRVKPFMTELLQRRMADNTIVFPRLPDREEQYAAHTYSESTDGRLVYEKGNDHIIDADRCAVLAHYLDTEEAFDHVDLGVRVETF